MSLVIIPCHSVWKAAINDENPLNLGQLPEHWVLAPFQLEGRDHFAMIKHGLQGVKTLVDTIGQDTSADANNMLFFSGSKTKPQLNISEGESYYKLIQKILKFDEQVKPLSKIFDDPELVDLVHTIKNSVSDQVLDSFLSTNVTYEECSLDSFDNLYYSLLKYHEMFSVYPKKIVVVGFEFKRKRFVYLHGRKALGIDIEYIGIDPKPIGLSPEQSKTYFDDLKFQESKNALVPFEKDWYAVRKPLLDKKQSRNPFGVVPSYPELISLHHPQVLEDREFFESVVLSKYKNFEN
ncbi:hypothetical protein ACO0RG_002882 [Hanseniaspora osmophila]|uniref:Uncharacterized protein n=1 Tax=Hanseniaspora osmophila TaxID=56408 RepID=A0A1E5R7U7_9ASCO|nr:Uncharacterized protein AWRI3579_g3406 [Hanseniaspora osmophila]